MAGSSHCIADMLKKPHEIQTPFGGIMEAQKILVLSPHHDDEILGCGGTLLRYMEKSAEISILYFTDGKYGIAEGKKEERRKEAESVWNGYEFGKVHFWDYADAKLYTYMDEITDRLSWFIRETAPDIIFTPWMLDAHKDHESVSVCLAKALQKCNCEHSLIACYEVAFPLYANHTVNITKQMDRKMLMIDLYKSQVGYLNIKEFIGSLNSYRAQVMRFKSIKAAEGFFIAKCSLFLELVNALFKGCPEEN